MLYVEYDEIVDPLNQHSPEKLRHSRKRMSPTGNTTSLDTNSRNFHQPRDVEGSSSFVETSNRWVYLRRRRYQGRARLAFGWLSSPVSSSIQEGEETLGNMNTKAPFPDEDHNFQIRRMRPPSHDRICRFLGQYNHGTNCNIRKITININGLNICKYKIKTRLNTPRVTCHEVTQSLGLLTLYLFTSKLKMDRWVSLLKASFRHLIGALFFSNSFKVITPAKLRPRRVIFGQLENTLGRWYRETWVSKTSSSSKLSIRTMFLNNTLGGIQ